jgi:hypothetical protein
VSIINSTATRDSLEVSSSSVSRWAQRYRITSEGRSFTRLGLLRLIGHVIAGECEAVGKPVQGLTGLPQPQRAHPGQNQPDFAALPQTGVGADLSLIVDERHAVEERGDVLAAQRGDVVAEVRPLEPEAFRQASDPVDVCSGDATGGATAPLGEIVVSPLLGCFAQPRLGDPGEDEVAEWPKAYKSQTSLCRSLSGVIVRA